MACHQPFHRERPEHGDPSPGSSEDVCSSHSFGDSESSLLEDYDAAQSSVPKQEKGTARAVNIIVIMGLVTFALWLAFSIL